MKRFCLACLALSGFLVGCGSQDASIPSEYSKSTLPDKPPAPVAGGAPGNAGGGSAPVAPSAPAPKLDL
ncbi:hypothetical protein SH501x_003925 [Pirellulaceae bacterium SH501]